MTLNRIIIGRKESQPNVDDYTHLKWIYGSIQATKGHCHLTMGRNTQLISLAFVPVVEP